jgi:phosphoglycerate dehydrogenase-like enzyme
VTILLAVHSPFEIWTIPLAYVERLRTSFPSHTFLHAGSDAEATARYPDAEVVFAGQITRAQLASAQRLRWLHSPAAGVGGMLFPEMLASHVVLTNSRGMSAQTIAEHVLAVTLAIFRRLPHAFRSQAARAWAQDAIGAEGNRLIAGSQALIVGLGAIGSAVAQRLTLLGARVTGLRRRVTGVTHGDWTVAPADQLHALLPGADLVVLAAPHTRDTRGLIGARELSLMSPQSVLVNVSRGQLVDEAALAEVLRAGRISAAALDVFVDEPLPPESPFWTLPNVLITPHTSGFRPDHWDAAIDLFADNLRRFDDGRPLLNVVDKEAGY